MLKSRITQHIENTGRIMVTDGGAHPPEFWSQVTAEHIAAVPDDVVGQKRFAALALQGKIAAALEPHHRKVQDDEGGKLLADANHHNTEPNPEAYLDEAVADVIACGKDTEWEEKFARVDVQAAMRAEIANHFATSQSIAKSYHRDSLNGAR